MSDETLMTPAPAAAPDAGAGAAPAQSEQTPTDQAQAAAPAAGGQTPEAEQKPAGAPESYEFKHPDEGGQFDESVTTAFAEVAKDLNLSQEAAQKVLDKMSPVLAARQTEAISAARSQWLTDSKADAEFGGAKLDENLGVAKKAIDTFATQPLKDLLNESGLGNHPEVVRLFFRVGKAISEDGFVGGAGAAQGSQDARSMYGKSNMNP